MCSGLAEGRQVIIEQYDERLAQERLFRLYQDLAGALGNSYSAGAFMLRQAQHERVLPVLLIPNPFALSLSKGEQRLFQRPVARS